eukprot:119918-Alexandrium_andersonii.AAC.1
MGGSRGAECCGTLVSRGRPPARLPARLCEAASHRYGALAPPWTGHLSAVASCAAAPPGRGARLRAGVGSGGGCSG